MTKVSIFLAHVIINSFSGWRNCHWSNRPRREHIYNPSIQSTLLPSSRRQNTMQWLGHYPQSSQRSSYERGKHSISHAQTTGWSQKSGGKRWICTPHCHFSLTTSNAWVRLTSRFVNVSYGGGTAANWGDGELGSLSGGYLRSRGCYVIQKVHGGNDKSSYSHGKVAKEAFYNASIEFEVFEVGKIHYQAGRCLSSRISESLTFYCGHESSSCQYSKTLYWLSFLPKSLQDVVVVPAHVLRSLNAQQTAASAAALHQPTGTSSARRKVSGSGSDLPVLAEEAPLGGRADGQNRSRTSTESTAGGIVGSQYVWFLVFFWLYFEVYAMPPCKEEKQH